MVDDDNAITAGDDTGMELVASCAHATQTMVNSILAGVKGHIYQAYSADDANINPAAELGDGVTVNGIYSVISRISDDGSGYPDLSAPGEEELEDEYPAAGPMTQEFNRKIAQTRSSITKTAEQIRLEVENELEGLSSAIKVDLTEISAKISDAENSIEVAITTLDGLTVTDSGGTVKIKGGMVTADGLHVNAANIDGTLTANQINLTGAITWGDLAEDSQNEINGAYSAAQSAQNTASNAQNTANSAANTASSAYSLASNANNTVSGWVYPGTTYINGNMLMTGTVKASILQGGTVGILNNYGNQIGYISVGASTSTGIQLASAGNLFLASSLCSIQMEGNELSVGCSYFYPRGAAPYLGYAGKGMWQAVYAYTGTIQTSDANFKHDIEPLPEKYIDMVRLVDPKRFKLDNGTSDRYHVGFIAQDFEAAMEACGIESSEFGGFVRDTDSEGNNILMLRYEEMIGILWGKIKRLESKLSVSEG